MTHSLFHWLDSPRTDAGIRFADGQGGWTYFSYSELAERSLTVAAVLIDLGLPPGSRVSFVLPTDPDFPATLFGSLLAGLTPNPIAPPFGSRQAASYPAHAAHILTTARPGAVVADTHLQRVIGEAVQLAGVDAPVVVLPDEVASPSTRPPPPEIALMQFSSGSTGKPSGITISPDNLEHNIQALRTLLAMTPNDGTASWLPLHHDMGLIGCLLTPIVNTSPLWLMHPRQFIKNPMLWLERFGSGDAVISAGPAFGYAHAAMRAAAEGLPDHMSFEAWRAAFVGAERIEPDALALLTSVLQPYGFNPRAFLPAYGLAEATLAVTCDPLDKFPRLVRVNWAELTFGKPVPVSDVTTMDKFRVGSSADWFIGCGPPLPGTEVAIVGDDGQELPELVLGEIVVRGESVASGYVGECVGDSTLVAGTLRTGDAGFLYDGDLFVLGRMGDGLNVRGQSVFVESLESHLLSVPGIPIGRFVVVAGSHRAQEVVAVLAEAAVAHREHGAIRLLAAQSVLESGRAY